VYSSWKNQKHFLLSMKYLLIFKLYKMQRDQYLKIMRQFFNEVQNRLPKGKGMGSELGNLLGKSENTIYRKVRGEIGIPLEEYIKLVQHFGLELPIFNEKESLQFNRVLQFNEFSKIENSLFHLKTWLQNIAIHENDQLSIISPSLHPIHFFACPSLQPLLFWHWKGLHSQKHIDEIKRSFRFPQDFRKPMESIYYSFQKLPVSEYLSNNSIKIYLKRIERAHLLGIASTKDSLHMLEELEKVVLSIYQEAENSSVNFQRNYKLYFVDEANPQSLLIQNEKDDIKSALVGSSRGLYMETSSVAYCKSLVQSVIDIKENSVLISSSSKRYRMDLFDNYDNQIQSCRSSISKASAKIKAI
jgi:hypothetical protein